MFPVHSVDNGKVSPVIVSDLIQVSHKMWIINPDLLVDSFFFILGRI